MDGVRSQATSEGGMARRNVRFRQYEFALETTTWSDCTCPPLFDKQDKLDGEIGLSHIIGRERDLANSERRDAVVACCAVYGERGMQGRSDRCGSTGDIPLEELLV
jgi:hypothetical protein